MHQTETILRLYKPITRYVCYHTNWDRLRK
nr:MAG TPA: hypothetical protein [Caudoviricetes sp.]DAY54527.1 MAG TPA: hypothetical protein [Caudoviricetes sp.]